MISNEVPFLRSFSLYVCDYFGMTRDYRGVTGNLIKSIFLFLRFYRIAKSKSMLFTENICLIKSHIEF